MKKTLENLNLQELNNKELREVQGGFGLFLGLGLGLGLLGTVYRGLAHRYVVSRPSYSPAPSTPSGNAGGSASGGAGSSSCNGSNHCNC